MHNLESAIHEPGEEYDQLPVLRLALAQIIDRLLRIWSETPLLSSYPAFGGEAWHYP